MEGNNEREGSANGKISSVTDPETFPTQNSDRLRRGVDIDAPTFYSQMAKVVEGMKQEKFGAASVVSMLRGKGVKAEEIKWSGIEAWLDGKKSVTKAELQEFIRGSMLQIDEEVRDQKKDRKINKRLQVKTVSSNTMELYLDGELHETFVKEDDNLWHSKSDPFDTYFDKESVIREYGETYSKAYKWEEYKLDGGKNYREIVFKIPGATHSNTSMQNHWGAKAKGVLAHARLQDFKVNGKKMLFIEEIQSDWHNEGHNIGYKDKGKRNVTEIRKESESAFSDFSGSDVITSIEQRLWNSGYKDAYTLLSHVFDGEQDAFEQLADLVDLTSEEISFIDDAIAEESQRRSEMKDAPSKYAIPDAPFRNSYHEFVLKRLIRMAAENGYDSIGWTTADIQSERWSDEYAEGYRIEYDQDIPKFLKKYGKQWGADVGKINLKRGTEVWSMAITDSMKESVLTEGQPLYQDRNRPTGETVADALESVAGQGDLLTVERYRDFYGKLNREEQAMLEANARLRQIETGAVKATEAEIRSLRTESNRAKKCVDKVVSVMYNGNACCERWAQRRTIYMKTILFQGDSITDCGRDRNSATSHGVGYPLRVRGKLFADAPCQYNTYNRGIGGNRIVDLYARMRIDILQLKPDYMSILIGINDVWHEYTRGNGVAAPKFEKIYSMLIEEVLEELPNLKIMIMEPFVLPGSATCNTEEHPHRWEYFRSECELRAAAARRVAERFNLTFVPLQEMFDKVEADMPEMGYWLGDGVHPTAAGHELLTRRWLEAFEKIK